MLQWLGPRIMTPLHVRLYRLLGGRLVGGASVLLLTTVGRRSDQPRTVTVGYLRDGEDVIMTDSNNAKPTVPAWVLNLRAHPEAEVRLGRERYQARAEFLEGEDRASQWDRLVAADPLYDRVQRLAGRELSVIRLGRIKGSSE
jgi:deazaflavin-dependent oxidoreductase (nitroreductase family)